MKPQKFMIVYDNEMATMFPMCADRSCEGAVEACGERDSVLLFNSREAARRAIRISTKHNELLAMQGKPHNEDFTPRYRQYVRIVPCVFAP